MRKPVIVANISFRLNPQRGRLSKGGHRRSKYCGGFQGLLVFSSEGLEKFIDSQGLDQTGEFSLLVNLIKFANHYLAEPNFDCLMPLNRKKRAVCFVDAQNLFFSLRTMRCSDEDSFELFKRICALHDFVGIYFYFCPASDVGSTKIVSYRLMAQLQALEDVTFIEKDIPLNGSNGNGSSSNIDNFLITDLVRTYYELPGIEGVVLVSGDHGFVYPLRLWSIGERTGGPKYVEVIASRDAMSGLFLKEDDIKKTYIEDLLKAGGDC